MEAMHFSEKPGCLQSRRCYNPEDLPLVSYAVQPEVVQISVTIYSMCTCKMRSSKISSSCHNILCKVLRTCQCISSLNMLLSQLCVLEDYVLINAVFHAWISVSFILLISSTRFTYSMWLDKPCHMQTYIKRIFWNRNLHRTTYTVCI